MEDVLLRATGIVRGWVDRKALEQCGIFAHDLLYRIDILLENKGR